MCGYLALDLSCDDVLDDLPEPVRPEAVAVSVLEDVREELEDDVAVVRRPPEREAVCPGVERDIGVEARRNFVNAMNAWSEIPSSSSRSSDLSNVKK